MRQHAFHMFKHVARAHAQQLALAAQCFVVGGRPFGQRVHPLLHRAALVFAGVFQQMQRIARLKQHLPVVEAAARVEQALLQGAQLASQQAALFFPAEITLRFVDAEEGKVLNHDYRGKDYATNVLTFDYSHEPVVGADLVICAEVVEQEAKDLGIAVADHYAQMLVHGTLHAQGYDHEEDDEAELMESRESEIMLALGFADPYQR